MTGEVEVPVAPGGAPSDEQASFILSCHRSGSTLLRYIIDTHPDIFSPPELFVGGCAFVLGTFEAGLDGDPVVERPEVVDWLREVIGGRMALYTAKRQKKIWCEKTPDNLMHLELLDQLFPRARHVCLYRHGLDVAASASKMAREISTLAYYLVETDGHAVAAMIRYWTERTLVLRDFELRHAERCYRLKYEDLVASPEAALEPMFTFLGVRWDPGLLDQVFTAEHADGIGDPKARFTGRIHKASVGGGRNLSLDGVPRQVLDALYALLETLGYPPLPELPAEAVTPEPPPDGAMSPRWLFDVHLRRRLSAHTELSSPEPTGFRFEVSGEGGGAWVLQLSPDGATLLPDGAAACTIRLAASDLLEVAVGRLNAFEAYQEGRLEVDGRFELVTMKKLLNLLQV